MPVLPKDYSPNIRILNNKQTNRYKKVQMAYNKEVLSKYVEAALLQFNKEQRQVYDAIINNDFAFSKSGNLFFVDGPGGTGKTFLYNTILAKKDQKEK
jgi:chromosomal replication initiation ATPase DnaA